MCKEVDSLQIHIFVDASDPGIEASLVLPHTTQSRPTLLHLVFMFAFTVLCSATKAVRASSASGVGKEGKAGRRCRAGRPGRAGKAHSRQGA